jgi:hypothetical protein
MKNSSSALLKSAFVIIAAFPVGAFAQEQTATPKKPPFEMHAYGRLGVQTSLNPFEGASDSQSGVFQSRHTKSGNGLNHVRMEGVANLDNGGKFDLSAQIVSDGSDVPHHDGAAWAGAAIKIRDAYLELPVSEVGNGTSLWFGARRMEFEDIRLFDVNPLSEPVFYGAGTKYTVAGVSADTAIGTKNGAKLAIANDPKDAAAKTTDRTLNDLELFQRFDVKLADNMAFRPTLIVTRTGTLSDSKYKTVKDGAVKEVDAPKATTHFTAGAVLSTWGDSGWNNSFVYLKSQGARDGVAASDKAAVNDSDYVLGLATSGDFEGLKSSASFGLLYAVQLEMTSFKYKQQKYKIEKSAVAADGDSTGSSNIAYGLGVQPVYYLSKNIHGAMDINYSATTMVGDQSVSSLLLTPILRYAVNENAMGTPQIFTSVTYGMYGAKTKRDGDNKRADSLVTAQSGFEVWF